MNRYSVKGSLVGLPWWENARHTTGWKKLWLVTRSHCNRLKISVARGWLLPCTLFPGQEGSKAFPPRGCHLTPRTRHRAFMCWVREMTCPWGNCSLAHSPSEGHAGAVQGWTSEPSLNFFNLAFVWIESRRQRATEYRKHSIKVLARLPPPCHIPSHDTSWLRSPASRLGSLLLNSHAIHSIVSMQMRETTCCWSEMLIAVKPDSAPRDERCPQSLRTL